MYLRMIMMMWPLVLVTLLCAIYLTYFLSRLIKEFFGRQWSRKVWIGIYFVMAVISFPAANMFSFYALIYYHFVVLTLILEAIHLFAKRWVWFKKAFYSTALSWLAVFMVLGYGYYNMNHVQETTYTIESDKIDDFKILQVTDLHMSNSITPSELEDYVLEMSQLNPDIVVLTGDIVDEQTPREDMEAAIASLSQIDNQQGIYYIFGNHDFATYSDDPEFDQQDVINQMESHGIVVLQDQSITIGDVTIVGRLDYNIFPNRLSSEVLIQGIDKDQFILCLDHQPRDLQENANNGYDLQLSGHTHGGGIFPARELEELVGDRLVYGLRQIDDFTAITSSGISAWGYPIKTDSISEYVLITVE